MFVPMESVWMTGFFQSTITSLKVNIASIPMILTISAIVSQFISNVPLVALYLPMLAQAGASTKELIALAAGSTIAGNMTILGAASNVIVIQNAGKKSGDNPELLRIRQGWSPANHREHFNLLDLLGLALTSQLRLENSTAYNLEKLADGKI